MNLMLLVLCKHPNQSSMTRLNGNFRIFKNFSRELKLEMMEGSWNLSEFIHNLERTSEPEGNHCNCESKQ